MSNRKDIARDALILPCGRGSLSCRGEPAVHGVTIRQLGRRNALSDARRVVDAVHAAAHQLAGNGLETPRLDAEVLIRHVAGWDRTAYFLHQRDPLPPNVAEAFATLVARRLHGEPVAYLTGIREFMGLPFTVSPDVLVPRPETELLVEWALAWLDRGSCRLVLDLGTGSGAIILALAAHGGSARGDFYAGSDLSAAALAVAQQNQVSLAGHGAIASVRWVRGHLGSWSGRKADLILANLPYLRPDQLAGNRDLAAEPALALVAGDDGLALIRQLIEDLPRLLAPGGAVGLEIDPSQADEVAGQLSRVLPDAEITVRPDLAGHARHVTAERAR